MNKIFVVIFFFSVAMSEELKIGSLMPKIGHILNDISGKNITLADAKGESGTLVIFSCNTCPWVIRWEDRYVSIAEKYVPMGIGIIAVNSNSGRFKGSDSMEAMIEHADKENYTQYYNLCVDKLKSGGIIIADNVLWYGKVVAPNSYNDELTQYLIDFNEMVKNDDRVENIILPLRDGLNIIIKN